MILVVIIDDMDTEVDYNPGSSVTWNNPEEPENYEVVGDFVTNCRQEIDILEQCRELAYDRKYCG